MHRDLTFIKELIRHLSYAPIQPTNAFAGEHKFSFLLKKLTTLSTYIFNQSLINNLLSQ